MEESDYLQRRSMPKNWKGPKVEGPMFLKAEDNFGLPVLSGQITLL
jgi:hypothetical protein